MFKGFHRISKNFHDISKVSRDFKRCPEISREYIIIILIKCLWISIYSTDFHGVQRFSGI